MKEDNCVQCGEEIWVNSLGYCKKCMQAHIDEYHREQSAIKVGDDVLVKTPGMKKPLKGVVYNIKAHTNVDYEVWLSNQGLNVISGVYLKRIDKEKI
jgi:hypothetical protein